MAQRTVSVNLVANIGQYVSGMNAAAGATMRLGDSAAATTAKAKSGFELASKGAVVMGAAVAGGMALAVSKSMDFEKAMSGVQAATQASGGTMEELRKTALKLGADSQYSAKEAADGITEMAKAGVSAKDIIGGGLKGALNLAAAGQLEVAEAAEIGATALSVFGLEGSQMSHVADLLAAGAGKAQGSVSDMAQALNQSALVAKNTGLTVEDTAGALALFASKGLLGSDAGTSFRTMLMSLNPRSKEAAELMDELGLRAYDASGQFVGMEAYSQQLADGLGGLSQEQRNSALATIFGTDAIRAATILYESGGKGVKEWTNNVNDAGFASRQAAQLTDNLAGDLERLGGAFDTLMIEMGSGTQGPLRDLVQGLTTLIDAIAGDVAAFERLPMPVQAAISAFSGLAGLAGDIVGLFLDMPGPMQMAVVAALGWAAAGDKIMGILRPMGGALEPMRGGWRAFGEALDYARANGDGLGTVLRSVGDYAGGQALNGIKAFGRAIGPELAVGGAVLLISQLVEGFKALTSASDSAKSAAQGLAQSLSLTNEAMDREAVRGAIENVEGLVEVLDRAGISSTVAIDGLLGNARAQDQVTAALQRYMGTLNPRLGEITAEDARQAIMAYQELSTGYDGAAGSARYFADEATGAGAAGATAAAGAAVAGEAADVATAQMMAAAEATEAWRAEMSKIASSFVEPLNAYKTLLQEKQDAEQAAAEKTAAATESASDSWRDYAGDVTVSLDELATRLEEQILNQENWRTNIVTISQRAGEDVAQILFNMGEEGVDLVAQMANGTDAEVLRMADLLRRDTAFAGQQAVTEMDKAMKVMAEVGRSGAQTTASEIAAKLGIGVEEVARIAAQYGVKLAEGINPVLTGLGRPNVKLSGANGFNTGGGYAEGGYTGPGGKYQPAGIVHAGEVVWSQDDVRAHGGPQAVDAMRRFRGYAEGGIVALGRRLQSMGARVAGHPSFGGVTPGAHGKTSYHYSGQAIDVNTRAGTSPLEQRELAPMAALARQLGFRTIFMSPGHYNHLHVDTGGARGSIGSIGAMAPAVVLPKPPSTAPYSVPISTAADAAMQHAYEQASAWVAANTIPPEPEMGGPTGAGVERWRGLVVRALGMVGQSTALANTTLRRMNQESGGNPRAINNWDINAKRGTPSKGLMQVIDPTFRAYAMAGYNRDIWDPLSNVLASMRYAMSRYGSLSSAYNRPGGYANGGTTPAKEPFWVGEEGPELMWSSRSKYVSSSARSREFAEGGRGAGTPKVVIHSPITFTGPVFGEDAMRRTAEAVVDRRDAQVARNVRSALR